MQEYIKASEHSIKTKDENAGNLIIYTRDDLERMQVLTLKDLLKSIRYFTYSEDRSAQSDLLNLDAFSNHSKGVRVYLNEHELLAPLYGSGFVYFGEIELEFIDHVEIYTGFPSFEFGIEPARVIIRLYSKDARHDEGGKVKGLLGSNDAYMGSTYYTDRDDEFSYFAYASSIENNRESVDTSLSSLNRDHSNDRFYGSFSSDNHQLELHAFKSDSDAFLGKCFPANQNGSFRYDQACIRSEVLDTRLEQEHLSLSTHSTFMDKRLKLNLSYSAIDSEFYENFNRPDFNLTDLTARDNTEEESFTALLQKDWDWERHDISLGVQYRFKYFDISDSYFNGAPVNVTQAYDTEQVYSAFVQDVYHVDEVSVLSISIMNQFYSRNGSVNEPDNLQLRLGYVYDDEEWMAKTTLAQQTFASEPYSIISSGYGNVNLESESYFSVSQELMHRSEALHNNFLFDYARLTDYPLIGPSGRPENSDKNIDIYTATYEAVYFYSQNDKLEFHLNYSLSDNAYMDQKAKRFSTLLRGINTFGKWDVFNEIWCVDPAYSSKIYVDYTVGVDFRATKDLSLQFKAENVFDRAEEFAYIEGLNPATNTLDYVDVSVTDPKVWFGLEYLF